MKRYIAISLIAFGCTPPCAWSSTETCQAPEANQALQSGMARQSELDSEQALKDYENCLKREPTCVACLYEIGWSYWKLGRWEDVITTWEKTLKLKPDHEQTLQFLPTARENLNLVRSKKAGPDFRSKVALAIKSTPADGPLSLFFLARRQSYDRNPENPLDIYDEEIHSPKSVRFTQDGKHVYVNSLEAGKTVLYDTLGLKKVAVIKHKFGQQDSGLFDPAPAFDYRFPANIKFPNRFFGKPVELEITHHGKYLWTPYYRRSFDQDGTLPSAVAIIDTQTNKIIRVIGTGPISKYVRASPKGHWLAISHWGDNTVGLLDIRSTDPKKFKHGPLLTVGQRMSNHHYKGDRDKDCGFCVRGLAWSPDEKYLFVSRMKGGGIAAFEITSENRATYLGTLFGILPGPRDLEMSQDGQWIYSSCNASGFAAKIPVANFLTTLGREGKEVTTDRTKLGVKVGYVGLGARSIRLSPDEKFIFVAVNVASEIVALSTAEMKVETRIPVDSYPVGLDLSPDGLQLWVTSQGRSARGGNSIGVFQVRYQNEGVIHPQVSPSP